MGTDDYECNLHGNLRGKLCRREGTVRDNGADLMTGRDGKCSVSLRHGTVISNGGDFIGGMGR